MKNNMALIFPIDYLQDIIYTKLSSFPQIDSNGNIIPNSLKFPFFSASNIILENQEYEMPDTNQYQASDINPFYIRILTSESTTLSRSNTFLPLSSSNVQAIEYIKRQEAVTFTFVVFSYKLLPQLLPADSLFLDPTSGFYKSHSASNVIYDVYNALLSSYAQGQAQIGNILLQTDSISSIKNYSLLEGGQIQERWQFDIQAVCSYENKNYIDNYNTFTTTLILD